MSGVLFSCVRTDPLDKKFSKNWVWTEVSLWGNNKVHVD